MQQKLLCQYYSNKSRKQYFEDDMTKTLLRLEVDDRTFQTELDLPYKM